MMPSKAWSGLVRDLCVVRRKKVTERPKTSISPRSYLSYGKLHNSTYIQLPTFISRASDTVHRAAHVCDTRL